MKKIIKILILSIILMLPNYAQAGWDQFSIPDLEKMARDGNFGAMLHLGNVYFDQKKWSKSIPWYEMAAKKNWELQDTAQYNLANAFENRANENLEEMKKNKKNEFNKILEDLNKAYMWYSVSQKLKPASDTAERLNIIKQKIMILFKANPNLGSGMLVILDNRAEVCIKFNYIDCRADIF